MRSWREAILAAGLFFCWSQPSLGKQAIIKEPTPTSLPAITQNPEYAGVAYDSTWAKQLYVITDSVVLGASSAIKKGFKGWKVTIDGHESMGIQEATRKVKEHKTLPPVVVVAVGYNSSWEKDRKNFEKYAKQFDDQAEAMLKAITTRGAKKIIWVLLREPTSSTKKKHKYYEKNGYYFSYVNERLKELHSRHPEIALADWSTASADPSLTADGIHLNAAGSLVMVDVIKAAIGL